MIIKKVGSLPNSMIKKVAQGQLAGQEVSCDYCGGVYLIEGKDIKMRWRYIAYQTVTPRLYVKCPTCKAELWVTASDEQRNSFVRWWHILIN